jgi:phosphoribosylglycinamide formyltransferase-1
MIKIGILGSTRGSLLEPIYQAIAKGDLNARIEIVVSNRHDAFILTRAKVHHIPNLCIDAYGLSREQHDRLIDQAMKASGVDLIIMMGYMRIVSKWFTDEWKNRIINVHPSLLPLHAGLMNLAVHEAVINNKEAQTGCTVHFVNENVDAGKSLIQKRCLVDPKDTALSLRTKVQALEAEALIEAISQLEKVIA